MEMVQSRHILQTLDRLISEMNILRSQVAASLENSPAKTSRSVREAEYFGMWANRDDIPEGSSSMIAALKQDAEDRVYQTEIMVWDNVVGDGIDAKE